jgi:hypothetical protein
MGRLSSWAKLERCAGNRRESRDQMKMGTGVGRRELGRETTNADAQR